MELSKEKYNLESTANTRASSANYAYLSAGCPGNLRTRLRRCLLDLPNLSPYASTLHMSSVAPLLMREGIMEKDFMDLREHRKKNIDRWAAMREREYARSD